jgi:uncharacterized protein YqjF (DUF2071 family)
VFSFLKDHPFAVEAFFDRSTVLTFAAPKEELKALLPELLELDTLDEKWAFIAVALVQTRDLRPKGFPKIMGNDFFLIGYRIFVRYTNRAGKRLRGLYILKSQTDKKKMEILGNTFTHYNYTTTDLQQIKKDREIQIRSSQSGLKIDLQIENDESVGLPAGSPFSDWKEARRYAGPLPFTFTYQAEKKEMLIIEGVRENWKPQPVKVMDYHIPFINSLEINNIKLANAFVITGIPYWWKRGRKEQWSK